tara:strand:- start:454 stop:1278 length:825 start_codon:yes stop_codon:yes gene_type:complete
VAKIYNVHLISDSTGETTQGVLRACAAQFEGIHIEDHIWSMIRSFEQMDAAIKGIQENRGPVIFTLVSSDLRQQLMEECFRLKIPCVSVLDPTIDALATYFGRKTVNRPGGQHTLNAEYFDRIEALHFVMDHDDGQSIHKIHNADVILVGVSRTSKTPTSIYLANHYGLKAANVPYVPKIPLPSSVFNLKNTLTVGLTASAARLVSIRRNRLLMLKQEPTGQYADIETVKKEVIEAKRLFSAHHWPVIDVTRRSIEETAAAIYQLYNRFLETKK